MDFLRIGEFCSSTGMDHNLLHFKHLIISPTKLSITLPRFKHSKRSITVSIMSRSSRFCPVMLMKEYVSLRSQYVGPIFIHQSNIPVTRNFFAVKLSNLLILAGKNPKSYSSHSFRIGAATWAAKMGYSEILSFKHSVAIFVCLSYPFPIQVPLFSHILFLI